MRKIENLSENNPLPLPLYSSNNLISGCLVNNELYLAVLDEKRILFFREEKNIQIFDNFTEIKHISLERVKSTGSGERVILFALSSTGLTLIEPFFDL